MRMIHTFSTEMDRIGKFFKKQVVKVLFLQIKLYDRNKIATII